MVRIVGVKFRNTCKTYFFDPAGLEIKKGNYVVVETAKGIEYGIASTEITEVDEEKIVAPLKSVLRLATDEDRQKVKDNLSKEKEAFGICLEKIAARELEMKLTDVEYAFDGSKILFYFTADGRVDFRELVKDLASVFRTRIELRQIGVRDEARAIGGYGGCGRPLCCATFLSDFAPVSIKMAKEQNLSLNPTKISGVCGRLMCCLKNEEETYEELNRSMPGVGDIVRTADGREGEIQSVNVLRQTAKVLVEVGDDKELVDATAEEMTFIRHKKGKKNDQQAAAAMAVEPADVSEAELAKLEAESNEKSSVDEDMTADKKHQGGNRQGQDRRGGRDRNHDRGEGRDRSEGRGRDQRSDGQHTNRDRQGGDGNRGKHGNYHGKHHGHGNNQNRGNGNNQGGGNNPGGQGGANGGGNNG